MEQILNKSKDMSKFYLILATLGRRDELIGFLESLKDQTFQNFELIIVDQNETMLIEDLIKKYSSFYTIHHIKIKEKGLSLARNVGIKYLNSILKDNQTQEIILAFPDDDCEYPKTLLEDVVKSFEALGNKYNILTGISIDKKTLKISAGKFEERNCEINCNNFLRNAISFTIFIRQRGNIELLFDENLGAGSSFGSAEESDYLYRLLKLGFKAYYYPEKIKVYHPLKRSNFKDHNDRHRVFYYGKGLGALFKKHLIKGGDICLIPQFLQLLFIRPIGGMLLGLLKLNFDMFLYYKNILLGRWIGLLKYK
jgi:glycosyltransferase involved in cell wall biosynthesis